MKTFEQILKILKSIIWIILMCFLLYAWFSDRIQSMNTNDLLMFCLILIINNPNFLNNENT